MAQHGTDHVKLSDVNRLQVDGLISADQAQKIAATYHLKDSRFKLPLILAWIAVAMVFLGIALVVASNWDRIPGLVKIANGLILMIAAHSGGYWLRHGTKKHPLAGEILHVLGGCLFLSNVAIIGQVYNLSSREPDAFLLWTVVIAPLPWILRSKAAHVLFLTALTIWVSLEAFSSDGLFHSYGTYQQMQVLGTLGLALVGGSFLIRGGFGMLSGPTLKMGWSLLNVWLFFLCLGEPFGRSQHESTAIALFYGAVTVAYVLVILRSTWNTRATKVWIYGLAVVHAGFASAILLGDYGVSREMLSWAASGAVFCLSLLGAAAALELNSNFLLRGSLLMTCAVVVHRYFALFADLMSTGFLFISTGVLLLVVGYGLRRYSLRIKARSMAGA
jgi:uncharacterized membrane protein